jgi:thiamine-monophosphate kinase
LTIDPSTTLAELGELRLIEEVILPLAQRFDIETIAGDDCAYIDAHGTLAITADVGPKPLLQSLPGYERDLDAAGWLAAVATASDVATAGAEPLFLTNCIDAPPETTVGEFTQFLGGYFCACTTFGFKNGGGDVRHGPKLAARVFGAGIRQHGRRLGRDGVSPGDHIAIVGPAGDFMATYLLAKHGDPATIDLGQLKPAAAEVLRRPRPQLEAMQRLAAAGAVTAASDTSDGLIGAVENLCRSSNIGVQFNLRREIIPTSVSRAAELHGVDPWNLFMAWGDWSVVVAVPPNQIHPFEETCQEHGIRRCMMGIATTHAREMTATLDDGGLVRVSAIRNENFVSHGFNADLDDHLAFILKTPLFKPLGPTRSHV